MQSEGQPWLVSKHAARHTYTLHTTRISHSSELYMHQLSLRSSWDTRIENQSLLESTHASHHTHHLNKRCESYVSHGRCLCIHRITLTVFMREANQLSLVSACTLRYAHILYKRHESSISQTCACTSTTLYLHP